MTQGLDTPINTFHEWELRALDRELVELPLSDLNAAAGGH